MPALSCRSTTQSVIATVMAVVAVAGWLPIVSIPAAAAAAKIRVVRLGAIEATSGLVVGDHCVFVSSDRHIDQPLVVIDRATFSVTRSLKNTPTTSMVAIGDSLFVVPRSGSPSTGTSSRRTARRSSRPASRSGHTEPTGSPWRAPSSG